MSENKLPPSLEQWIKDNQHDCSIYETESFEQVIDVSKVRERLTSLTEQHQQEIERLKGDVDNFAISFAVWTLHDPQAKAYQEAGVTAYKLLELYKDRPFIDTNPLNQ